MDDPTYTVMTTLGDRAVIGADTMMVTVPAGVIATVDGTPVVNVTALAPVLRKLSEQGAAAVGERLHHGEWVITGNPAVVDELSMLHDCDDCRAGRDRALGWLAEHPGESLLVGHLFWAGP